MDRTIADRFPEIRKNYIFFQITSYNLGAARRQKSPIIFAQAD
jgi:hypothetical protein